MADIRTSADDAPPPIPQALDQQRDGSIQLDDRDIKPSLSELEDAPANRPSDEKSSGDGSAPPVAQDPPPPASIVDPAQMKQVGDVLSSEIGIPTLLNRLKQSLVSAKEFATFLKKRSLIEDNHAQDLKKLIRTTQENIHRSDHRQGSFGHIYNEMMFIHDRMAENGSTFAASLHQMHEDLTELVNNTDRNRKMWKTNGLAAEQKVADMEQTMRKSKTKYDSLAEEYDRARTGEARQGGKVLGAFKAHKSAAQQEEDLLRKVQGADQTYLGHVQMLQAEKKQLVTTIRPEAVRALQDLISEVDSAVALQMQKFASFNEKLLLGNGLTVSPFTGQEGGGIPQRRSLRQAVSSIDNEKDLNDFVGSHHAKVPVATEVKYERNPVLNPQSSAPPQPSSQTLPGHVPQQSGTQAPLPQQSYTNQQPISMASRSSTGNFASSPSQGPGQIGQGMPPPGPGSQDPSRQFVPQNPHNRSYSQGNPLAQHNIPPQQFTTRNSAQPTSRQGNNGPISSQGPPQLGALPFQGGFPPEKGSSPHQAGPPFQAPDARPLGPGIPHGPPPAYGGQGPPAPTMPTSSKPVFGVPLNRLYERDGLAVPMVVHQCIQAVDLFGLGVEGIYRQSGSLAHINKLKNMFDADASNPILDFRNPESFYHDVNSVTGLLKQFFRDLPDPVLTMEHHDSFIAAAKREDDIVRRDSLHAIINSLPDPNYATLRALSLHLYRVTDNAHMNRMNARNLAVIFGPTLMGSDPSTAIADAGWQIKVVETILQNTYQIFDDE